MPRRSQVVVGLAIMLSLTNVVVGRSYGLTDQGITYVNTDLLKPHAVACSLICS
jgi:hypothetical protein